MRVTPKPDSFDTHVLPNRSQLVSGGKDCVVRTNAHPMETFTDPASTRTRQRYDWKTGRMETEHATILENARGSMTRLRTRTVTSARTHPDPVSDFYGGCPAVALPKPSNTKKKKR